MNSGVHGVWSCRWRIWRDFRGWIGPEAEEEGYRSVLMERGDAYCITIVGSICCWVSRRAVHNMVRAMNSGQEELPISGT